MKLARGDAVLIEKGMTYWFCRTEAEIEILQESDRKSGRLYDSAGESIIYSLVGSCNASQDIMGIVTKIRGIEWPTWYTRPKHLTECILTINGIPKYVMVRGDKVKKMIGDENEES